MASRNSWLISVFGVLGYATLGSLFVVSMHVTSFDVETVILQIAALVLLALTVTVPTLRLRTFLPVYTLFPYCFYVAVRFCGDMGPVHFLDSVPFLFAIFISFTVITGASVLKIGRFLFRSRRRNRDEAQQHVEPGRR